MKFYSRHENQLECTDVLRIQNNDSHLLEMLPNIRGGTGQEDDLLLLLKKYKVNLNRTICFH